MRMCVAANVPPGHKNTTQAVDRRGLVSHHLPTWTHRSAVPGVIREEVLPERGSPAGVAQQPPGPGICSQQYAPAATKLCDICCPCARRGRSPTSAQLSMKRETHPPVPSRSVSVDGRREGSARLAASSRGAPVYSNTKQHRSARFPARAAPFLKTRRDPPLISTSALFGSFFFGGPLKGALKGAQYIYR